MDFIILDRNVELNGKNLGNFININKVDSDPITGDQTANINISNTEINFTVFVTNNDIKQSVQNFFDVINDKE